MVMPKAVIALLVSVGLLFGVSAPANAGTKWTTNKAVVEQSRPKQFQVKAAAPSTMLTKNKTCSANNTGYRVRVEVDYVVINGKVDINKLYSQYEHRRLGLWGISDWASSSTDDLVNAGGLWGTITRNPGAKNNWYTASPAFTPNGLKIGVRKASGSDTALSSAGCFISLP